MSIPRTDVTRVQAKQGRLTFLMTSTLESPAPSPGRVPLLTCVAAFFRDPDAAPLLAVAYVRIAEEEVEGVDWSTLEVDERNMVR